VFKKIISYFIAFIGGIAAIFTGLAISKRRGSLNGAVDNIRELGEGQRKLDSIAKSDAATIKQARSELDGASESANNSANNIGRAKDIIEELRKRKADSNNTISDN
jgi:hypothetical protein